MHRVSTASQENLPLPAQLTETRPFLRGCAAVRPRKDNGIRPWDLLRGKGRRSGDWNLFLGISISAACALTHFFQRRFGVDHGARQRSPAHPAEAILGAVVIPAMGAVDVHSSNHNGISLDGRNAAAVGSGKDSIPVNLAQSISSSRAKSW